MYFSSDSWGKISKNMDLYLKDTPYYQAFESMEDVRELTKLVFKPSEWDNLSQLEMMKKVLEGLQVPVQNPTTGEQDYVDITLVNKIVVDAEYIQDMEANNVFKVQVALSGDQEKNDVVVKAKIHDSHLTSDYHMPLQDFEEMLYKAIHEVKSQRLEEVPEFQMICDDLMLDLTTAALQEKKHLARLGKIYEKQQGIGIIRDIKANQDIGTFESISFSYEEQKRLVSIEGVLLSGRLLDDLEEKERFEFVYYSLGDGWLYSFMTNPRVSITTSQLGNEDAFVEIEGFELLMGDFTAEHKDYAAVEEAQAKKALVQDIDEHHPLYSRHYEEFRQNRLSILEESKQRLKKEKLVNQFADIEFDF